MSVGEALITKEDKAVLYGFTSFYSDISQHTQNVQGRYSGQHSATQETAPSDNHSEPERVTIRLRNLNLAINGGPELCYDVNWSTLRSEWLCPEVFNTPVIH